MFAYIHQQRRRFFILYVLIRQTNIMNLINDNQPIVEIFANFANAYQFSLLIIVSTIFGYTGFVLNVIRQSGIPHKDIILIDNGMDQTDNAFFRQSFYIGRIDFFQQGISNTCIQIPIFAFFFQFVFIKQLLTEIVLYIRICNHDNALMQSNLFDSHLFHKCTHFFGYANGTACFSRT